MYDVGWERAKVRTEMRENEGSLNFILIVIGSHASEVFSIFSERCLLGAQLYDEANEADLAPV